MEEKAYQSLIIPKLKWNESVSSPIYGELVVQPLEAGYGITLGNALRRAVLSSIEGAAVTSVIIKGVSEKGVNNEFSTIKGVIEDTLYLLMNIKGIVVKNSTGKPGKMHLKVSGERLVTAKDITCDDHLELINKDHEIAHLAVDGELEIDLFVEMGRGCVSSQWPQGVKLQPENRV